ncbi:MAG: hypothetical protein IPK55_11205 [Streptococcus sp.]|nr:hypothetical protein [Streptococcus sp.]
MDGFSNFEKFGDDTCFETISDPNTPKIETRKSEFEDMQFKEEDGHEKSAKLS